MPQISNHKNVMSRVAYWLDIADYDLETAQAMLTTHRWLYVAFMCHKVLEKTLKAYWCATQPEEPPYTHNLIKLSEGSGLAGLMSEEQNSFIDELMPLNIESRYPEYKRALMERLTPEYCQYVYDNTNELQQWIKNRLLK